MLQCFSSGDGHKYLLYPSGNQLLGVLLLPNKPLKPVILKNDYLANLSLAEYELEFYYLYRTLDGPYLLCNLLTDSNTTVPISGITPVLIVFNRHLLVIDYNENGLIINFPLESRSAKHIAIDSIQFRSPMLAFIHLDTLKIILNNSIVSIDSEFNSSIIALDTDYEERIKNVTSDLENAKMQYNELAILAQKLQDEGKKWRDLYYKSRPDLL